jgi:hypothetical protein
MEKEKLELDVLAEENAVQEEAGWLNQKIFNEVTEEIYQRGSFSVAIIHAYAEGKLFEGVGFSKARQEISAARYDSERGKTVARGRAIHDLFGEFKRRKDGKK